MMPHILLAKIHQEREKKRCKKHIHYKHNCFQFELESFTTQTPQWHSRRSQLYIGILQAAYVAFFCLYPIAQKTYTTKFKKLRAANNQKKL